MVIAPIGLGKCVTYLKLSAVIMSYLIEHVKFDSGFFCKKKQSSCGFVYYYTYLRGCDFLFPFSELIQACLSQPVISFQAPDYH